MRLYSKLRPVLFAVVLGVIFLSGTLYAQNNDAAAVATDPAKGAKTGLFQIVLQSQDFVTWTIVILSVIGLTLIIQGFMKARASVMMPEATINYIREMIANRQFKELIDFTETDDTFISKALNPALKRAPSFSAMKEAMETALGEQTAQQFRRIEYLNIIGNLGPLLGLLGTVIGMIHAFQAMNEQGGQANPAVLSGGISKALAHTMMGLILALPCLSAFGILRTIIDRLTVQGALVSEELLLMVKPSEAKPAAAAAIRPGGVPQPASAGAPARKPVVPAPGTAIPNPR